MNHKAMTWFGVGLAAILATIVTAVMHQFPTEFVGSQHDSLHVALTVAEPGLFAGDAFVETTRQQPTLLWNVVGWLVPLEGETGVRVMTVGVVLFNLLFFVGVAALVRAWGGGWWAMAGAMAVLCGMGDPLVGANYIVGNHITASSVVAGPLLLAVALAVRGHLVAAMALIGLCANVHVLQSAYVGGLVVGGACARHFLSGRGDERAMQLKAMAGALGAGILCAAPVIWMIMRAPHSSPLDGWADVVLRGHVIHYYLFSQLPLQLVRAAALLVLGVGLVGAWWFASAGTSAPEAPSAANRQRAAFLGGVLAMWVVGFLLVGGVLSDLLKMPLAIKAQPLRATAWVLLIVVAGACTLLGEVARHGDRRALAWALVGALGVMLVLNVLRPFGGAFNMRLAPFVVLFSALVALAPVLKERLERYAGMIAALAWVGPGSVLIVWTGTLPGLEVMGTGAGFQILVLVLFLVGFVWWTRDLATMPRLHLAATTAWVTALAITALVTLDRVQQGHSMWFMDRDEAWHEAARFVAESTPFDAVLQGDPRRTGLRSVGRRSVFHEQNDDHALYVDAASLDWLRERAELLRMPLVKTYGRQPPWSAQSVPWGDLSRDHGVTHAMVPADAVVAGEVLFANDQWQVVALEIPRERPVEE